MKDPDGNLIGVWLGNDDNSPMERVAGGTLPAGIWRRFMIEAHKGVPAHDFDFIPAAEALPAPEEPPAQEAEAAAAEKPAPEVVKSGVRGRPAQIIERQVCRLVGTRTAPQPIEQPQLREGQAKGSVDDPDDREHHRREQGAVARLDVLEAGLQVLP